MSHQGRKLCNEGKRELIFHEVKERSTKTLSSKCEVVDVKVNEDAIKLMSEGKRLADSQPVVTLSWDTASQPYILSTCVVEQFDSRTNLFSITVLELLKNEKRELVRIVETIHSKFNARITTIHGNPMTFCLLSQDPISNTDITALEGTFRNLVERFNKDHFHVEVKRHDQQARVFSKTSEELSVSMDLSSSTKTPAPRTLHSLPDPGIDDTERQFQEIENSLNSQRKSVEKRFQEQQMQSIQIEEKLKMLMKKFEEEDMSVSSLASGPSSVDKVKTMSRKEEGHQATKGTDRREQPKEPKAPQSHSPEPPSSKDKKMLSTSSNEQNEPSSPRDLKEKRQDFETKDGLEVVPQNLATRGSSQTTGSSTQAGHPKTREKNPDDTALATNKEKSFPKQSSSSKENQELRNIDPENEYNRMASQQNIVAREQQQGTNHGYNRENMTRDQTDPKRTVTSDNYGVEFDMDQYRENQQMMEDFQMMHSLSAETPPRANALDTLFCLDTSASMGEDGLQEMKAIALSIVDGIEDIATDHGIEENLAVVQFGGHPIVAQSLTNDYGTVRETIESLQLGGTSPLRDAILMCLQALYGQGGSLSIKGVHVVPPRVIVITDGKISTQIEGTLDADKAEMEAKINLLNLLSQLEDKDNSGGLNPIVWIPAGKAEKAFLQSLGKRRTCVYVEGIEDRNKLSSYQRIQTVIGTLFLCIQDTPPSGDDGFNEHADMLLDAIAAELSEEDKRHVLEAVKAKLDGEQGYGNPETSANDFDNIYEDPSIKYPLGTRVTRGPDWMWENQDTNGPGTIINHGIAGSSKEGYLWVEWDNGSYNRYRFGVNGAYDVWEAKDQFRNISSDMSIEVGCEVTRGPDWKPEYGDQDGGCKGVGVVIRKKESGLIKVRWKENAFIGTYHYSNGGRKDVSIRDPLECFRSLHQPVGTIAESETGPQPTKPPKRVKEPRWSWRWKDDKEKWHQYSENASNRIEQEYVKGRRSCLIRKEDGQSFRILFESMKERGQDSCTCRMVERIDLNADVGPG